MKSTYKLVISSGNLRGTTGHHEIQCFIRETRPDGKSIDGTPETFGCESMALERKFGGDIKKWRQWVGREMLRKHKSRMLANAEILKWSGQEFDIEDE
jgi:hypothetical protein